MQIRSTLFLNTHITNRLFLKQGINWDDIKNHTFLLIGLVCKYLSRGLAKLAKLKTL